PHTSYILPTRTLTPLPPASISTLSLHDALPICFIGSDAVRCNQRAANSPARLPCPLLTRSLAVGPSSQPITSTLRSRSQARRAGDRKSTRLNSSHVAISYAVFCLQKKKRACRSA